MSENKRFKLNGRIYEIVAMAQDQSKDQQGKLVIYRELGQSRFFSLPLTELKQRWRAEQPVDWQQRLTIFKQRFVGRTDVYAERYFNKKMQKKAYSPAGPWENGQKSKTTHFPLTDAVLRRHFSSTDDYAIGLYPLSQTNTTPFLAIDIDGHHDNQPWQALMVALQKICVQYQVPHLVELSQSGRGCHFWLFFTKSIAAVKARQLGDVLLQATQAIEPRLPFTAFDRLFPAQDQLDNQRLGNLIAAPLEGKAMVQGRSTFIDGQGQPVADPWRSVAQVATLDEDQVANVTRVIREQVGLRLFDAPAPDTTNLFTQHLHIEHPIQVRRADALYIAKPDLSQHELLQLKWLASFHNPEFYQKQRNRLPIYNVPRIISLFRETAQTLILPRGLEDELVSLAPQIIWNDQTVTGHQLHAHFNGNLRTNQQPAFAALCEYQTGILAARTGFGKTVIAAAVIAKHQVSTLILVNNKTLAEQWHERLSTFLTIADKPVITELTPTGRKKRKQVIGTYYGTKKNPSGLIDIATVQSFQHVDDLRTFLDRYGMVISDEVHHDAAYTADSVIAQIRSTYLYGLSATPYRRDGQEPIIVMRFGKIRYETDAIDPEFALTVQRRVLPRFTNLGMTSLEMLNNGRTENNLAILNDSRRNAMIIRDCQAALANGRHVIVLTNLVAHVDELYAQLPPEQTYRIYGGFSAKERAVEIKRLNKATGSYAILATVATAGEGLDVASLDTMILAMPIGFHGNVEQVVGRMHRDLAHKSELRIYDYVDMFVPMLARMYRQRCKVYRQLGYEITEDEHSKQQGLQIYDGQYQAALMAGLQGAKQLLVVTPKIKPFLTRLIQQAIGSGTAVTICTETARDPIFDSDVKWVRYEQHLPNWLIVDDQQLWLSTDTSFSYDHGLAVRLDHPELIRKFRQLLVQTMSGFAAADLE